MFCMLNHSESQGVCPYKALSPELDIDDNFPEAVLALSLKTVVQF